MQGFRVMLHLGFRGYAAQFFRDFVFAFSFIGLGLRV